jgi:hypothetical protein
MLNWLVSPSQNRVQVSWRDRKGRPISEAWNSAVSRAHAASGQLAVSLPLRES